MNIICYMNQLYSGGAERVMSVLASGLSSLGHWVCVATDYSSPNEFPLDPAVERVAFEGRYQGVREQGRVFRSVSRILKLRKLCKERQADVLISFVEEANFRALLATRFLPTKNLISVRTDPQRIFKRKIKAVAAKLLYPLADGCVFQTLEIQSYFPRAIQRRSQVICNPISDMFYHADTMPMQEKRVVACGRLQGQKRFDLLIDAFHQVSDQFPDYKLEIYGGGPKKERLLEQIHELGRQDRIFLMGKNRNIAEAIGNASLFVLSSNYEGLPNALMEAMALGLPVVSTDCGGGGARALIENYMDGMLVPCDDAQALANAIAENLADPQRATARGEKAKEKAAAFRPERVVAQWEEYIRRIVIHKH